MAPTIIRARPVHAGHMHVAYELISQYGQLPSPTTVAVSTKDGINVAVELTVDTASAVDAWAEAMNVDVEHELHRDGTWTDHAHGMLTADTRAPYEREHIVVHVYSPQTPAHPQPHPHIGADGKPYPCTHLELCAADDAAWTGGH